MNATVTGLAVTPVKAMRLQAVDAIELGERGAEGNRRFYVIDEQGEMVNGKRFGALQTVVATCDDGELALQFPDGREVRGPIAYGDELATQFSSRPRPARALSGPWSQALSEYLGAPLRIVDGGSAVDRGRRAGVSLISADPCATGRRGRCRLRRRPALSHAGRVDGTEAHEEDGGSGRPGAGRPGIGGDARSRRPLHGHHPRPREREVDLPTLELLAAYRRITPAGAAAVRDLR